MTKQIEAVYERGVFRPLEPIQLPEGARLDIILISRDEARGNGGTATSLLAEIAALPSEGATNQFAGRDHDSILYPEKPTDDLR